MIKKAFVFACCAALMSPLFAANQDQNKKKKGQGQGGGQGQQQHMNAGAKGRKGGQGQRGGKQKFGQQNKFQRQNKFQGQNKFRGQNKRNLPAVQKNKQQFRAQKRNLKGQKFQAQRGKLKGQKFKTRNIKLVNKINHKVPKVVFKKNFVIRGSRNWIGPRYAIFRNYHPLWQNRFWWTHHYNHIVFLFGGWYYWNAGAWYPAWGYDPGAVYYFDGPIVSPSPEMDPGQVVANVQSALQEQGYYQGDIDGILGPQTRAALADYQQDNGLEPTSVIDEPTLDSLGMA
jgi:Putative peptidoglycan binding domain